MVGPLLKAEDWGRTCLWDYESRVCFDCKLKIPMICENDKLYIWREVK